MMNTILPGDTLMVTKLLGVPGRGDIVVFRYPGNDPRLRGRDDSEYVGRVIGLPGESIQIKDEGVIINGSQIDEERVTVGEQGIDTEKLSEVSVAGQGPYRVFYPTRSTDSDYQLPPDTFGVNEPFHIPPDCYFIMGDNRDNSYDSRYRGAVKVKSIWGKISRVFWSESKRSGEVRWERVGKEVK